MCTAAIDVAGNGVSAAAASFAMTAAARGRGGNAAGGAADNLPPDASNITGASAGSGGGPDSIDWSDKPYLCTGFDCFMLKEPCAMCAMALLHSRVARVVYCQADPADGVLGGSLRMHAERSLNHHYLGRPGVSNAPAAAAAAEGLTVAAGPGRRTCMHSYAPR
jgi:tRNA-specific adenosine deaminase 3